MTTPSSNHSVDFEELCWLVGRARRSGEDIGPNDINGRNYWIDHIRDDYGPRVADVVRSLLVLEDGPRQEIEFARRRLHAAYTETYLYVLEAYNRRETT